MSEMMSPDRGTPTSATARKPYHSPEVRDYGALREVTQTSTTVSSDLDIATSGDGGPYVS